MKIPNNKLSSVKSFFIKELSNIETSEVNNYFNILCDVWLGLSKTDLIINPDKELTESEILKFLYAVKDIQKNRPIQYIAEKSWFYGLEINVKEGCLIPRPETEELVDWIIQNEQDAHSFLDIGTGSGCIPLALKNNLKNAEVSAYDVSEEALLIATSNASRLAVNVDFHKVDILNWERENIQKKFDVIVSNPPYIPNADKALMAPNVLEFEPGLALFVENSTPIIFYERIADFAGRHLDKNGRIYFEIHESYAKEVEEMLQNKSFKNIEIKKDLQGKDRMVRAKKNSNQLTDLSLQ